MRRKPTDEECAFLDAITMCFKPGKPDEELTAAQAAGKLRMAFRVQFIRSWKRGLLCGLGIGCSLGWILVSLGWIG